MMHKNQWGLSPWRLVTTGYIDTFKVPLWVIVACSGMIALGTSLGGWKLIRTLGSKFYKIKPVDAFCSQLSSAAVILGASLIGGPVSTTQVVSTAIMGVGAAERVNKVRWGVAGEIATAWFLTIPATHCGCWCLLGDQSIIHVINNISKN